MFAFAARRSPVTGFAFIYRGAIRAQNERLRELGERPAAWRQVEGASEVPSLSDAIMSVAAKVGERAAALERWERTDGDQTIDVRVERIGRASIVADLQMATIVDVTDSVRVARELEDARTAQFQRERFRSIGELASGFAHDFNNTLNAMNLWIARLGQSNRLDAENRRAIDALTRIVADAAVRVGQLQDFSRSRSDVPDESLSLADVVRQAVEVCRAEVEGALLRSGVRFRIETRIPGDLPLVRGSAAELRHVFLNLLLNARDAMPRGGTVRVAASRERDSVVVSVEDEGIGIPEQHLSRVFDPFFTTKGNRGTGLGLSIAHQVMQRLGGSITAANRRRSGAVFRLAFPIATGVSGAAILETAPRAPPGRKVLIIDDDEDNLEATRMVLEGMGQTVAAAPSGRAALDRLRETRFDLVLCDVGMPGVDGWQVAERAREIAPGTAVYMVTGWANEIPLDDPHRALVAGVLPKPLALDTLARILGEEAGRAAASK